MKKFKYVSSYRSNGDEKDNNLIKIVEVKLEDLIVVGSSENISLAGSRASRYTSSNPYRHIGSEWRKLLRELSYVKSLDLWGVFKFDIDVPYDYDAVESVPSCIVSRLKTKTSSGKVLVEKWTSAPICYYSGFS